MAQNVAGIYRIRNTATGRFYIGSSESVHRRLRHHLCSLRRGNHHNRYLQNAWNRDGESVFEFEVLEVIEDLSQLLHREQFWIDYLQAANPRIGYNLSKLADRVSGVRLTLAQRRRRSERMKGHKVTSETKAKISSAAKVRFQNPEARKRIADNMKGKPGLPHTQESKAKIAAKRSQVLVLIDPQGRMHRPENVRGFCKENGLTHSNIFAIAAGGAQKTHRGWRAFVESRIVRISMSKGDRDGLRLLAKLQDSEPSTVGASMVQEWLDSNRSDLEAQLAAIAQYRGISVDDLVKEWLNGGEDND